MPEVCDCSRSAALLRWLGAPQPRLSVGNDKACTGQEGGFVQHIRLEHRTCGALCTLV